MTSRLKLLLRRFLKGESGAFAIIFTLAVIPMFLAMGVAVDGARLYILKSQLQAIADSATISAGADPFNNSKATLDAVVTRYLNANGLAPDYARVTMRPTTYDPEEQRYTLVLQGEMDMTFMRLAGFNTMQVVVESQILRALPGPIELSMALDITTSMNFPLMQTTTCPADGSTVNTQLTALRCGFTTLLNDLSSLVTANSMEKIKVGVVPFGNRVNVGVANARSPWLASASNASWSTWTGCVGYRRDDRRATIIEPTTLPYPLVPGGFACPRVDRLIVPLTEIWTEQNRNRLKSVLAGTLSAATEGSASYIPAGLLWAWHVLHNDGAGSIFTQGRTQAELESVKGKKVIVLFTDGWNNTGPTFATEGISLLSSGVANANTTQDTLCTNIKNAEIELFVVSFLTVSNPTEEQRLRSCASSPRHFFKVQTADQLITAFRNVAVSFRPVRLTD